MLLRLAWLGPVSFTLLLAACGNDSKTRQTPEAGGTAPGTGGDGGVGVGGTGAGATVGAGPISATPFDYLSCSSVAPTPPAPPAGGTVVSAATLSHFGGDTTFTATFSEVAVAGQSFGTAQRGAITGTPPNPWNAQFQTTNTAAIGPGEVMLADFWARCEKTLEESNECTLSFIMEDTATYAKAITYPVRVGKDWTHFYVSWEAPQAYTSGGAHFSFFAGFADQTVDVGPLVVSSYGVGYDLDRLPSTAVSYPGIDATAAWRAEASARIDRYRRGDLVVNVKDSSGQPVSGASVQVTMKRHEFLFGSAISSGIVARNEEPAEYARYEQEITRLFNVVTAYNAFKWPPWEGDWGTAWDRQRAEDTLKWAEARDLTFRGHVLVWPGWNNLPKRLKAMESNPTALNQAVLEHIDEAMALTKGRVAQWDVVNEPFDNHALMDILGEDVVIEWFRRARAGDPDVKLFLNDYAILSGGGGDTGHRDNFEHWIEKLVAAGAPLDGLGMQSHFGLALTGPEDVFALLDRYGTKYDKEIAVTEYDINVDDENLAGCFTHDFMTTIFSHPKTTTFVMWGFWGDEDPLFHPDWSKKLAGRVFEDLIYQRWWTNEAATADGAGRAQVRAFYGTYEVTVTAHGKTVVQTVTHASSAPATVNITLP